MAVGIPDCMGQAGLTSRTNLANMYIGFKHFHSFFAYLVLLLLLAAVVSAIMGRSGGRPFGGAGRKLALFGLIATHIQLLLGIVLYFVSPAGFSNFSGANMGNSTARLYMLEHPLMMLIAVVLVTIGWSKAKRAAGDGKKYGAIALWYGLGLLVMLSRIPWAAWPIAG